MATNNNKRQRVVKQMVQLVSSSDNEWQPVIILANFPFFRIRERPSTKHPKASFLNLAEELEEELLNCEQKQAPKKEY